VQIVDGKIEGLFTRWHENGKKAAVAHMVAGVPHGVSVAWYPSGARKSRVVLEAGKVVSRQFFDDRAPL
jgi:antitoxin component YwqK of YwqJK toxin-antitoxin module